MLLSNGSHRRQARHPKGMDYEINKKRKVCDGKGKINSRCKID